MRLWLIGIGLVCVCLLGSFTVWRGYQVQAQSDVASVIPPSVAVTRGDVRQTVVAPGKLVGVEEVVLSTDIGGRLLAINVRPGERVRKGQVVAQLDTRDLRQTLSTAQARLEQAQVEHQQDLAEAELDLKLAQVRAGEGKHTSVADVAAVQAALNVAQLELAALQAGPDPADMAAAQAEVANAEADLRVAQANYDPVSWRPEVGMLPQAAELERATNAYNLAKARYESASQGASAGELAAAQAKIQSAQADYNRVVSNHTSTTDQEEATLEVAKAQLRLAQLQTGVDPDLRQAVLEAMQRLAQATVTAPFDGIVLEVGVKPGEALAAGQMILTLSNPDAVEVASTVIEEDLPLVQVGQTVDLFFDAAPDALVTGTVVRIVPQRTNDERPLYPVYIHVEDLPDNVLPGMTADGSIIVAERRDVLQLPRAMVSARADGSAEVQVWTNGHSEARTISTGLRGDAYLEIVDGLQEGDRVVGR